MTSPPSAPDNPIGVFDSGIGGLSVLRALRAHLPAEDFLYIADSAHAPYGEKPEKDIRDRCFALCDTLLARNAKAIVIACNTATAVALAALRAYYSVPIIALEPAVKPAIAATHSKIIGVLATRRTLESRRFQELAARFADQARIIPQPCPTLVTLLESGDRDSPAMTAAIRSYIDPLLAAGADTLVLGCTHFVFLHEQIQAAAGPATRLVDSSAGVARNLHNRLQTASLLKTGATPGTESFWSTAATPQMQNIMQRLWPTPLKLESLNP